MNIEEEKFKDNFKQTYNFSSQKCVEEKVPSNSRLVKYLPRKKVQIL